MKSYGVEVPEDVLEAGRKRMVGWFRALDIEKELIGAGCAYDATPSRVADRLLQKEKKLGNIKFTSGSWRRL
jgi:hypothetical protein